MTQIQIGDTVTISPTLASEELFTCTGRPVDMADALDLASQRFTVVNRKGHGRRRFPVGGAGTNDLTLVLQSDAWRYEIEAPAAEVTPCAPVADGEDLDDE